MIELMKNLDKAFYNYGSYINPSFYKENSDNIDVLDNALNRGYPLLPEMENIQELWDEFNHYIKFQSEYNETINDYII